MDADRSKACIGVFDSGLGGLTVARRLMQRLPGENIVYLGDSARVPYGIKSQQTIQSFAESDASFLMRFEPKLLVIACNTASAMALDHLQKRFDVPIIGVIEPGARRAVKAANGGEIGVMATAATIDSGAYERQIKIINPDATIHNVACPLLVPIVEDGRADDDPLVLYVLGDYLRQMQRTRPAALILGCTHYPLLKSAIAKMMGPHTHLIDSGHAAAEQVAEYLSENQLLNAAGDCGQLNCYTTDNPERFAQLAGRFLGCEVQRVTRVGTDELTTALIP